MAKAPTIAIFAHSAAKTAYLADLATRAGLEAGTKADAAIILAENTLPDNFTPAKDQKIFILGDHDSQTGVRAIQFPVKASTLIALLQNAHQADSNLPVILSIGPYTLDTRESLWSSAGKTPIRLTEKEVAILSYLSELKGSTVSREDLLSCVWDYAQGVETHTLETHIYRLRQKIETDPSNPKIIITEEDGYALGV